MDITDILLIGCSIFILLASLYISSDVKVFCILMPFYVIIGTEIINIIILKLNNYRKKNVALMKALLYSLFFIPAVVYYFYIDRFKDLTTCNPLSFLLSITSAGLLLKTSFFTFNSVRSSHWIKKSTGIDYGSAMSHHFFYGYLNIILPYKGLVGVPNLKELMESYEGFHGIKFDCYKLFILIPKSCHCPPSLEISSKIIESCHSLDKREQSVAGVKDRVYKNSVYKIECEGKVKYVVAEYATPLRTFLEAAKYDRNSVFLRKYQEDIVEKFYHVLQETLNDDRECRDYCELVYFDDEEEQNRDVGKVILRRLRKYTLK